MHTFAVVSQKHPGWIGQFQSQVLAALGGVAFNRKEKRDRSSTAQTIKSYISQPDSNRLLIFPEGTCVNTQFCVQFKQGHLIWGLRYVPSP